MSDRRSNLLRSGNRWCSSEELARLRRDGSPEAKVELRRAESRSGALEIETSPPRLSGEAELLVSAIGSVIRKHYVKDGGARAWRIQVFPTEPTKALYFEVYASLPYDDSSAERLVARLRKALPDAEIRPHAHMKWFVQTYPFYSRETRGAKVLLVSGSGTQSG